MGQRCPLSGEDEIQDNLMTSCEESILMKGGKTGTTLFPHNTLKHDVS